MKNTLSINSKVYYKHVSLKEYAINNSQNQSFKLECNQEYELSYIIKQLMLVIADLSLNILTKKYKCLVKTKNKLGTEEEYKMTNKVEGLSEILSEYVGMLNDDEKEMFRRAFFMSLGNIQKYENSYDENTKEALVNLDLYPIFIPEWKELASSFDANTGLLFFYAQQYFSSLLKLNFNMFEDEILSNGLFKSIFKVLADYNLLDDVEDLNLSKVLKNSKEMDTFYYLKVCFDYPVIREKVGLVNVYKDYLSNIKLIEDSIENSLLSIVDSSEDNTFFLRNLFITKFKGNKFLVNERKLKLYIEKISSRLVRGVNVINKNLKLKTNDSFDCFYSGYLDKLLFKGHSNYGTGKIISNWASILEGSYILQGETDKYNALINRQIKKIKTNTLEVKYGPDYVEINLRNFLFLYLFQDTIKFKNNVEIYDCYEVTSFIHDYLLFIKRISFLKNKGKLSSFKKRELQIEFNEHNSKILQRLRDVIFNEHDVQYDIKLNLSHYFDEIISEKVDVQYKDINLRIKTNFFNSEEILILLNSCLNINSSLELRLSVLNEKLNEAVIKIEKNMMKKQIEAKNIKKNIKKF